MQIVQNSQERSANGEIVHEIGITKYQNISKCSGNDQTNYPIYLDCNKLIKQIYEYIWIKENPEIIIQILIEGHYISIF